MKLITEELKQRFAEIGDQSEDKNPLVIAKFFDPTSYAKWYATEYYPETNICFGYVSGLVPDNPLCDEWGTFSIDELESLKLPIERDIHFKELHFDELIQKLQRSHELSNIKEEQEHDQEAER